jgi:hypothetical protein
MIWTLSARKRYGPFSMKQKARGRPVIGIFDMRADTAFIPILSSPKKVAQLQFLNRDYFFLFRGQRVDYKGIRGNTTLKPGIFQSSDGKKPTPAIMANRFAARRHLEEKLVEQY